MSRGFSIHVGVNNLSDHYDANRFGTLKSCIKDAGDMQQIAIGRNFEKTTLLPDATISQFNTAVREAAAEIKSSDDICLITFSGHGAQSDDGDDLDETDDEQMDETWCFHDRQLIDDEILDLLTEFKEGVRVLVISDSCHSGTIIDRLRLFRTNANRFSLMSEGFDFRAMENQILHENGLKFIKLDETGLEKNLAILKKTKSIDLVFSDTPKFNLFEPTVKNLPPILVRKIFSDHKKIYDEARLEARENLRKKLRNCLKSHKG